jgi:hypothetical protein
VEIERELAAEELKRSLKETAAAADPTADVKQALDSIREVPSATDSTAAPGETIPASDNHERS